MKVYIGEYPRWFGPYQFVDKVFFFLSDEKKDKIVDWIPTAPFTWMDKWFNQRYVDIQIDEYDTWNADHTLALIIHPLLVKFRENILGVPHIDSADVPDEVWRGETNEDEIEFKKWTWIVDEMIFAFSKDLDEDWESAYMDIPLDEDFQFDSIGKNPKFKIDNEKIMATRKRIENGHRLFGKYYGALWN